MSKNPAPNDPMLRLPNDPMKGTTTYSPSGIAFYRARKKEINRAYFAGELAKDDAIAQLREARADLFEHPFPKE